MPRFYVENFGCRATQADGAAIERQFEQAGLDRAAVPSQAEIVVLNTCTVTASADRDARAAIRRIQRENPQCRIVVTGCYAQRAPEEIVALPGVAQVIGNSHKHELANIALANSNGFVPLGVLSGTESQSQEPNAERPIFVSDIFAHTELLAAPVFDAANERTRPNLKVQDGCDNRCSFCVIPYVRGQSRSLPLERVLKEIDALVAAEYREVVISGINLGRWGRDLNDREAANCNDNHVAIPSAATDLQFSSRQTTADSLSHPLLGMTTIEADCRGKLSFEYLVRAILDRTSLEKLRISSVEPMDWTDSFIQLVAESPRIAKHAHVPMQSGSDRVLRAMHRKYRPWHYREKIEKIHGAMPSAAIGADVMVGFPGETDSDFEQTRRMVEELPFTYLHVFTYSARPGTPAASMNNQVPVQVARERNHVLRELAGEKKLGFMQSFVGRQVQAITLNVFDGDYTEALTDNYLKLRLRGFHSPNQWMAAQVEQVVDGALLGAIAQS